MQFIQQVVSQLVKNRKNREDPMEPGELALFMGVIVILVITGGIVAGLTIGLMSLDETNLTILMRSGTATQKKYAAKILPIRKHAHFLLVTLLLTNTIINETLPVLFHWIQLDGWQAVLASTGLILLFGEQAVCARHGLAIGAFFAWPVRLLMYLVGIVAYPIAKLLDAVLGKHDGVVYRRADLKELIDMHGETHLNTLTKDEVDIVKAVLDLRDKTVVQCMTSLDHVFMLPLEATLDQTTLTRILMAGHSRIPIYCQDRQNVIGVLIVKQLLLVDPDESTPIAQVKINPLFRVSKDTLLFDLLHLFEQGGSHMALIVDESSKDIQYEEEENTREAQQRWNRPLEEGMMEDPPMITMDTSHIPSTTTSSNAPSPYITPTMDHARIPSTAKSPLFPYKNAVTRFTSTNGTILGIVTLEDVIEELLGQEIIDETDVYVDVEAGIKVTRSRRSNSHDIQDIERPNSTQRFAIGKKYSKEGLLDSPRPLPDHINSDDEADEHSKLLSKSKTKIYEETSRILNDWLAKQSSSPSGSGRSSFVSAVSSSHTNLVVSSKPPLATTSKDKKPPLVPLRHSQTDLLPVKLDADTSSVPVGSQSNLFSKSVLFRGSTLSAPGTPRPRPSTLLANSHSRLKLGKELIPAEMLANVVLGTTHEPTTESTPQPSATTPSSKTSTNQKSDDFKLDNIYV